jgi:hypothetical protein
MFFTIFSSFSVLKTFQVEDSGLRIRSGTGWKRCFFRSYPAVSIREKQGSGKQYSGPKAIVPETVYSNHFHTPEKNKKLTGNVRKTNRILLEPDQNFIFKSRKTKGKDPFPASTFKRLFHNTVKLN